MKIASDFKPQFLPRLVDEKEPIIAGDLIETLAFVLSGIDPVERNNDAYANLDLRQLVADPSVKRIGPNSAMRQDYQFILHPKFDFTKTDFEEIWQDAKDIPSGQEATEFLKLAKQLHRLEMDSDGTELRSSKNSEVIQQIRENAHRLLHRIHRTAVRHIEEKLKTPMRAPSRPWYFPILSRLGLGKSAPPASVHIDADIRDEISKYLDDIIKLGRVLRANVRRG